MYTMTGSNPMCPVVAVLAGLTLVLVSSALPSQAANDHKPKLSINGTAICPNGWIPAAASSSDVTHQKLCVRVTEQLLTWQRARQDCRASRGFLIKLDSALSVDNVALDEYLKMRGLDTVWTGMHHEHGTLMWDDLQPHMVKAYHGKAQASGWKKRDWKFNLDSFKRNADTCGIFEAHDDDSAEISNVAAAIRTRRSPQKPPGVGRSRARLDQRQRGVLDNEEVVPSGSPADPSQSPLSQGLQEGQSDIVDITDTSDPQIPVNNSLSIDLTDTSDPQIPVNNSLIVDLTDTSDPQIPVNNSLVVDLTDTSDPQIPVNNSLVVDLTDTSDPQIPVNNSLIVDLTDTSDPQIPVNNSLTIDLTDTSDPHSADTNNDVINSTSSIVTTKSLVHRATETPNIDSAKTGTGTSAFVTPMMTKTNHTVSVTNSTFPTKSTMTTRFPSTTSNHSLAKESQNVDAQSNNLPINKAGRNGAKDFTDDLLSKRSTTSRPVSVMITPRLATSAGIATTTATVTIPTTTTTSTGIATTTATTTIPTTPTSTGIATTTATTTIPTTTTSIGIAITTATTTIPTTTTSTGIATTTATTTIPTTPTSTGRATTTATTTIPTTTTSTLIPTAATSNTAAATATQLTATEDLNKSNLVTNHPTSSDDNLPPTRFAAKSIPITKTVRPAYTGVATSKTAPSSITHQDINTRKPTTTSFEEPTGTMSKRSSTNTPVVTMTDLPVSKNVPVVSTTDLPVSTNVPVVSTTDLPVSTNIPVVSTTDLPVSTNIPVVSTTDLPVSTNIPVASTTHLPGSTHIPVVSTKDLRGSTNIPVVTTIDLPGSTNIHVVTTTDLSMSKNIHIVTTTDLPGSTNIPVMKSTDLSISTNIPAMATTNLPKSTNIPVLTTTDRPRSTNIPLVTTTDLLLSTVATQNLSTSPENRNLNAKTSAPVSTESFIDRGLSKPSATTQVPLMITSDPPKPIVATTTPNTKVSLLKDLVTKQSMPNGFDSSSSQLGLKPNTTIIKSVMSTTELHVSTLATTTTTTTHSPLTGNQDVFIPQSAPYMSKIAAGKFVSKRSTTNIPVMTTTDLPTSTVATTTSATSFPTPPSLTTSIVVTTQTGVQNYNVMNPPNDSLSTVASNTQATIGIPNSIVNRENTTIAALTTTKATAQADSTTASTPVSTLQLTETLTLTTNPATTKIHTPLTTTGVTNNTGATSDLTKPGLDDSSEVTDHANSPQYNPTATVVPGIATTLDITDHSSKEVDLDPAVNSTHVTGSGDLNVNNMSNTTGYNKSVNSGLDISSNVYASSISNIPKKSSVFVGPNQEKVDSTADKAGSTRADTTTESNDSSQSDSAVSQDASDEVGGSSSNTDEPPRDTPVQAPSNTVSLNQCEEEHASVCVTEAVEELLLVGHCDRNWYGHRLLDRCYKPVDFMLKALEARQNCLHYSASLATVDTGFYGNITALLLSYFAPGSKVWVDASLNLDVPGDGQCAALEDGQLHIVDCNLRLPFICQKDVRYYAPYLDDGVDSKRPMIYVQNLTSFQSQTLWCPLRMSAFDDVILWFKDGRPIVNQDDDDDDAMAFRPANGHMPNRLDIDLSILEHLGDGGSRIPKPAMLQGLYWCEIFRREPFNRVVSHKIFLKFTDVITLYGHITTEPVNFVTAAIFNRMGHVIGLPALIERRLATVNKNITHFMRGAFPIVRDIISFVARTNPDTGRSEFTTYICLATGDLSSRIRGSLVDLYISVFYNTLILIEDELQKEWTLTVPIRHAVALTMADMCPEANLFDRSTGLSATFPSTAVNNPAVSRHMCDGAPIGNAFCKGDLQSGAYWDLWTVTNPCSDFKHTLPNKPDHLGTSSTFGPHTLDETKGNGGDQEKPPKPDLVELNRVAVNKDNMADVSDRLADVVDHAGDLSALDIETIAQVVHRIVSLDKLSSEISDRLVTTANLVLDASEGELRKAEQTSHAPSSTYMSMPQLTVSANLMLVYKAFMSNIPGSADPYFQFSHS